jgi:hypothetical protein
MKIVLTMTTIAVILSLSGCVRTPPRTVESSPAPNTPGGPAARPVEGSGALAYIGGDGNVWITSPGQGWTRQVTTDATAPPEGQGRSYHRVVWLLDGSLAFAAVVRSGDDARGELYLQRASNEPPRLVAQDDEHFFIYLHGSPLPSPGQQGVSELAYLIEERNGLGLHLITMQDKGFADRLLAVGRPFYLSWSPQGQEILWHTGGAFRDNPAAEIGLYHVGENRPRILPYAPGTFRAPVWSPRGEGWLSVVASGDIDRLQYTAPDGATTLVTTDGEEVAFTWSPGGRHIAYVVREPNNPDAYGPIHLIDLETRETRQLTDDALDVLGFFWSPDGRRLAYLSRLDLPESVWMQWRTFDLADGRDRGFSSFHPSPLMRFIIHSFNQYAQSHRFWSPDGRYLVYAERDDQDVDRVQLVDTEAEQGADPLFVDEGSIGVWSWR